MEQASVSCTTSAGERGAGTHKVMPNVIELSPPQKRSKQPKDMAPSDEPFSCGMVGESR